MSLRTLCHCERAFSPALDAGEAIHNLLKYLRAVFTLVLCLLLIATNSTAPAFAQISAQDLPPDLSEQEFRQKVAEYQHSLGRKQVKPDDIDLNYTFKYYSGTDIFKLATNDFVELRAELERGHYDYEVPVFIDGMVYISVFWKMLPSAPEYDQKLLDEGRITQSELDAHNATVNTWVASSGSYMSEADFFERYRLILEQADRANGSLLLVGGFPAMFYPAALIPDDTGKIAKFVTNGSFAYDILGLEGQGGSAVFDYPMVKQRGLEVSQCVDQNPVSADNVTFGPVPEACVNLFAGPEYTTVSTPLSQGATDPDRTPDRITGAIIIAIAPAVWLVRLYRWRKAITLNKE